MIGFYVLRVEVFLSGFENSQGVYSTNRERRRVKMYFKGYHWRVNLLYGCGVARASKATRLSAKETVITCFADN